MIEMKSTTTAATTATESITLYYREGSSDKVYHAAIVPEDGKYTVHFAYGRRGSAMATGVKTPAPVPYAQARAIYDKLVKAKTAKGYTPGADGTRHARTGNEGRDAGILCQLANAVDDDRIEAMLSNPSIGVQEKHDGRRLLVRRRDGGIIGINRLGLIVALPQPLHDAVAGLAHDCLLDGELVGDTLHVFDLLELAGRDLRPHACLSRLSGLLNLLLPSPPPALAIVHTAITMAEKRGLLEQIRAANGEGVVFKDLDAPYLPGRPNSGGAWLKLKFVETASFATGGVNAGKRSVALQLFDGGRVVPAGNVTIPPNHAVPAPGTVIECRYLYAHRQSGAVYQPVYLGARDDIPLSDCVTGQLKYKAEPVAMTA